MYLCLLIHIYIFFYPLRGKSKRRSKERSARPGIWGPLRRKLLRHLVLLFGTVEEILSVLLPDLLYSHLKKAFLFIYII